MESMSEGKGPYSYHDMNEWGTRGSKKKPWRESPKAVKHDARLARSEEERVEGTLSFWVWTRDSKNQIVLRTWELERGGRGGDDVWDCGRTQGQQPSV